MGLKGFPFIPNGTGGLEERLSVLWTKGVDTGRITPNEFVAITSTNIAKILNMYPQKGAILEGADADVVVWDPTISKTVSVAEQKSIIAVQRPVRAHAPSFRLPIFGRWPGRSRSSITMSSKASR